MLVALGVANAGCAGSPESSSTELAAATGCAGVACGIPAPPIELTVTDTATGARVIGVALANVTAPPSRRGLTVISHCQNTVGSSSCVVDHDSPGTYTLDVVASYCDTRHLALEVLATTFDPSVCCQAPYAPQRLDVRLVCHPDPLPRFEADPLCPAEKLVVAPGAQAGHYMLFFVHSVTAAEVASLSTLLMENHGINVAATWGDTPAGYYALFFTGTEAQARAVAAESAVCFVESARQSG